MEPKIIEYEKVRYVGATNCGIPIAILLISEVTFHGFDEESEHYIEITEVIDWFKKEIINTKSEKNISIFNQYIEFYGKILKRK